MKKVIIGTLLSAAVVGTVQGASWVNTQYTLAKKSLPSIKELENYRPALTTKVYSRDGQLIASLFDENRTWTPLSQVSPAMRNAIVSVEDHRFYKHKGVDVQGIARAAWSNFRGGGVQEGASTISMQLARMLYLNSERTYQRKLREAMLATEIESKLSKGKILELYLNQVYFGRGAYGVGSAAQAYFGKSASQLTLAESTLLASLPQAPDYLSKPENAAELHRRQTQILGEMLDRNEIRYPEYRKAVQEGRRLTFKLKKGGGAKVLLKYPYFTSYVIKQLSQRYDHRTLYAGGLSVVTTLDLKAQRAAEKALANTLAEGGPGYNASQGAVCTVDHETGQILALVGGSKWSTKNQFNRAWQAERQAGSTFKAVVYAAALESGWNPNDVVVDDATKFQVDHATWWTPKNADGSFMGAMPLWRALMLSRNVVSAKLVADVGPDRVLDVAHSLGLANEVKQAYMSISLGAVEASPLQMASAFGTIANGGFRQPTTCILSVTDGRGQVIEKYEPRPMRVLSSNTAAELTNMLENVVESGTGTAAAIPGQPVAGKTGTSDESRDAWFVGFTPEWTTAVWIGNDDRTPMWGCYGGTLPAQVWHRYMAVAAPPTTRKFANVLAEASVQYKVCSVSNQIAGKGCANTYTAFFDPANSPGRCGSCNAGLQLKKSSPAVKAVAAKPASRTIAAEPVQVSYIQPAPEPSPVYEVYEQADGTNLYTNVPQADDALKATP